MIDSHCHLDLPAFDKDLSEVLQRARNAGVSGFLIPGTSHEGWQKQLTIQAEHPDIQIAFGVHPWFLEGDLNVAVSALEQHISQYRQSVCAVGEIGLDAIIDTPLREQEYWLLAQLAVAEQAGLPVILHHRKTHHRLPALIKQSGFSRGGVIHAFSGNAQIAGQYVDLGFKLGIGGTVTYPRGRKTLEAAQVTGPEHLLLETDSPDMPMYGFQGQRNEPQRVVDVTNVLAGAFHLSTEQISRRTDVNFHSLFGQP